MPERAGSATIIAVDQGTSSTKAIAVDVSGAIVGQATVPLGQTHPQPGWVEQDAGDILASVLRTISDVATGRAEHVAAVALSSQRESALIWSRVTGEPLGPVLGWQDRRTAGAAATLIDRGHGARVQSLTGLPVDPMFSALKFAWLLDEVDPDRSRSAAGEIALGTVDSYLLHALTGEHRIEAGNASRTQLLDLATGVWSDELLELFRIPRQALPRVAASTDVSLALAGVDALPPGTRITAVLGDSHAALFGHGVRSPGSVKVTLGTGSSIMGLLPPGERARAGLVTTIAWSTPSTLSTPSTPAAPSTPTAPDARLAFEGNILSSGSTVTWLAELLELDPSDVFALAAEAPFSPVAGVDLVPAFAGLGAPWWAESARASITGFDLGTSRAELARAAVESIVLQIEDVLRAAEEGGEHIGSILIDGGPAGNDDVAQLLANLSQRRVVRPAVSGLSALGAAHLAGLAAGLWTDAEVLAFDRASTTFDPLISEESASQRFGRWHAAVQQCIPTPVSPLEKESTP